MVAMVNVGGTLVPENQSFTYNSGWGRPVTLNAAQAANALATGNMVGSGGQWQDIGDQAGQTMQMDKPVAAPKKKAAPKAAPKPVAKRPAAKSALTAPPAVTAPSAPVTAKERAEVSKPAKGLENTIKTSPTLLRERPKRTYLTRV